MKRMLSHGVFMIALISLILMDCSSNDENLESINNSNITINEARQWFESSADLPTVSVRNIPREPVWDFASVVNFKNRDVVSVPLRFKEESRYNKGSRSSLVISKDGSGKMQSHVLKAIGSGTYMKRVNYKIGLNDFSGIVEMQDWEGNFISGEYYTNGKVTGTLGEVKTKLRSNARTAGYWITVYTDWYQQVCINGICEAWTYLDTFERSIYISDGQDPLSYYGIFYYEPGGGGGGGSSGGGGGGSGCPYGPNCNEPVPLDPGGTVVDIEVVRPYTSITNNVTNPCINAQVENVIYDNITNEVTTLLNQLFNVNTEVNWEFNQSNDLPDGTDAITDGYEHLNLETTFNANILPNASSEYILATMYHELLHGLLTYHGIGGPQQHEDMAHGYINILSDALRNHFPNLSNQDAIDLSWAGLQGTAAWNNLSNFQQSRINSTNNNHRNQGGGTRCID